MNLRSRSDYVKHRIDFISIYILIFLFGIFWGIQDLNFLLLIIFFVSIVCFILYKKIFFLFLSLFIIGLFCNFIAFNFHNKINIVEGEFNYVGENKIVTIKNNLWFNEKLFITDSVFNLQNNSKVICKNVKEIVNVDDLSLLSQGIKRSVKCFEKWTVINKNNFFEQLNLTLSSKFDDFTKDQSELLKGVTLGIKPSRELSLEFQRVGLSHILVISGFNITLILSIITKLFSRFSRFYKILISCIFILLFVLLVGPTPPVFRAAVMGVIGFISTLHWKNISALRLLLLSAVVMIFIDPYTIYSISFHLSFLATFGIILFTTHFNKMLYGIPEIVKEPISQSLAAGLFAIPYTITVFSTFSPAFLISNILILPLLSFFTILAYIYILFPISILAEILKIFSDFILQITFFLSSNKNSLLIVVQDGRDTLYAIMSITIVFIVIIFILIHNKRYNRVAKKLIIE